MTRPLTNYVAADLEAQADHEYQLTAEERQMALDLADTLALVTVGAMAEAVNEAANEVADRGER